VDRIIKIAAYFFCVVGSSSLCAMELGIQKSKDFFVVKKALLCDEIMRARGVPQEVAAIVKGNNYLLRMDTIYKKFDPFFHFNKPNYNKYYINYMAEASGCTLDPAVCEAGAKFAHENCRKFDAVTPQKLLFFTENHDEILSSLISPSGCVIHNQGIYGIQLTSQQREKYLMLPAEFRDALKNIYLTEQKTLAFQSRG
jgi:hypothetical protein